MMELIINLVLYFMIYSSLALLPVIIYVLFIRNNDGRSYYSNRDIFYLIKYFFAKRAVLSNRKHWHRKNRQLHDKSEIELNFLSERHSHWQQFEGIDSNGNTLLIKFILRGNKIAEASLFLRLSNGIVYKFPDHDNIRFASLPDEEKKWKINGLSIEILEPLIRARIIFNGILEKVSNNTENQHEHVRFNFIFNACRSPKFFPEDVNTSILADAIASQKWEDGSWKNALSEQFGYDQFGSLRGFIKIESTSEDLQLNFASVRSKYDGIDDRFAVKRQIRIFVAAPKGVLIHLVLKSLKNGVSELNYGSVYHCSRKIYSIDGVDIRLHHLAQKKNIPDVFVAHINTKSTSYTALFYLKPSKALKCANNDVDGYEIFQVPSDVTVNSFPAKANVEFWYNKKGNVKNRLRHPVLHPKKCVSIPETLVANISDEESKIELLTGGKGSSLALLSHIDSNEFRVPSGFILTVNAFKLQIQSNQNIQNEIDKIDLICCGRTQGNLEKTCQNVAEMFKNSQVEPRIQNEIMRFKSEQENKNTSEFVGWAVRSSAVGEDSEDLSAAGQNDTFLGIKSNEDILKAVAACWASLFSYQSVQYRWQHGLPIKSEIAVVIQKMVPSDCAGVLFTWHPTTMNPSHMVLTSNYGLGESVVSGKSEPDTIIINRDFDGNVSILEKIKGAKHEMVKLTENGTETVQPPNNEISIRDDEIIRLAKVAVLLENNYGGPRDIEWAFYDNNLYLLQSRPVTTLNSWSELELTHEFDTPTIFIDDVHTRANVGEVMTNPSTALGLSCGIHACEKGLQIYAQKDYDELICKGISLTHFFTVLDVVGSIHIGIKKHEDINSKILDLAIFGHPVLNDEIKEAALLRNNGGFSRLRTIEVMLTMGKALLRNDKLRIKALEEGRTFKIDIENDERIEESYKKIRKAIKRTEIIGCMHSESSQSSVFSQFLALNILLEGNNKLTTDHYADFAEILSSCEDVVSADIPQALENIAQVIRKSDIKEDFCALKPHEGVQFLKEKCPDGFKQLELFLEKHGHRTLGEFEIIEESWSMNPSKIVVFLQANVKHGEAMVKVQKTVEEVVDNLITPKRNATRSIIKMLLKKVRKAVGVREVTKSELIRVIDVFRKTYRVLAKRMVSQGILPSEDLVFHLSFYELGQIISSRNPLLITKAKRRKQLYEKLKTLRFSELIYGLPQPEIEDETNYVLSSVCKGTPVCTGKVKGRACVVLTLDEIDQLKKGDIMITRSTDIGWSPYFPLVSGVVTELGGLVTHGAVVAREYGLPCLVGAQNATKIFKTGDTIYLDTKTGEVGKI